MKIILARAAALTLAIGFLVDDAIVFLENTVRRMERGEQPFEAAINSAKEISFTILTMTTSLAAVFIPILFMSGILGRLFREFAVTITTAILISGVVSITLTPMLCSRFLRVVHTKKGLAGLMDRGFDRLLGGYRSSIAFVLRHRFAMLIAFFVVMWGTIQMYGIVPKGFIPDQDNDSLNVNVQAAQGTSYYEMVTSIGRIASIINANPYVDTFFASTGGGFGSMNMARFNLQLTPRRSRASEPSCSV